jgi:hypothetical protein
MLIDCIQLRPADGEEIEKNPEHQAAVVKPERRPPDFFSERVSISRDIAQAEINQADSEQAESAE